jgi:hypothetical protein
LVHAYIFTTRVLRPTTPEWLLVEDVLSEALGDVLEQGSAEDAPDPDQNPTVIDDLLRRYIERLEKISSLAFEACKVEVSTEKSVEDLAEKLKIDAGDLAKVNSRDKSDSVRPQTILLVPKGRCPGSWN